MYLTYLTFGYMCGKTSQTNSSSSRALAKMQLLMLTNGLRDCTIQSGKEIRFREDGRKTILHYERDRCYTIILLDHI